MKSNRILLRLGKAALVLLCAAIVSAPVTIRGSSGNGVDSGAPTWLLVGRSQPLAFTTSTKTATIRREIICLNQDVENAMTNPTLTLSGSCATGDYMYLFQVKSSSKNLNIVITNLAGFGSSNVSNYGVMICDSPENTIELCTNDPTGSHIPTNITAATTSNSVTFAVPGTFPGYPAGTAQQAQGLTFFVITQQKVPLAINLPNVSIK
jgi:hypothetical protein